MSASREKKRRQDLYSSGDLSKTPSHSGGSSVWKKVVAIICAIVFVVAFVLVMFANSGFLQAHLTAATVNNYKLTPAMYSYFYQDSISTIQNYFGQYWSSIVDTSTPPMMTRSTTSRPARPGRSIFMSIPTMQSSKPMR